MGWMHNPVVPVPSPPPPPSSAAGGSINANSGIGIGVDINNDMSMNAAAVAMYHANYHNNYPSMVATSVENIAMPAIGRNVDGNVNTSCTYRMAPTPMTPSLSSLSSSSSSSSPPQIYAAQTSPHDYNHNHHSHGHGHGHSHSHSHHRNPYGGSGGYLNCRATSVATAANMSPQQASPYFMAPQSEYPPMTANSNRILRNQAEKNRRDKLNLFINELSTLVPMVSNSPKKMDKTSVLRLATTFLRMHRVTEATRDQRVALPQAFSSSEWPQTLLDKMDGVMLIVTSAGKIVFISHNIEKVLGHTQIELMGHGLSNITFPPDLPELKRCLTPDKEDDNCSDNNAVATGSNTNGNSGGGFERQRRSFCLRLRHRCLARSEQPHYEPMQLNGFLRVPKKYTCQAQKKSRKCKGEMAATNSNEILFVAVMKPAREMTLMSIVEASHEEYVTRHWYDGRIIFCDQRISLVSGYLPEEVKGLQAFQFMAREEVHWVMIALRQMLWNREGFGKSCYRLKRKCGDFIYMVTHGYLEPCEDLQKSTFVCVNTLVSSQEGEREIRNMKKKFTPIIERKDEPAIAAIAEKNTFVTSQDHGHRDSIPCTEDPAELKNAIKAMVTNIPAPVEVKEDPEKSRELQFAKVKYISKTLPPPTIPSAKLITVGFDEKTNSSSSSCSPPPPLPPPPSSSSSSSLVSPPSRHDRLSPLGSTSSSTSGIGNGNGNGNGNGSFCGTPSPQQSIAATAVVSPSMTASSPGPVSSSSTSFQNRPSVLRIAPARQAVSAKATPSPSSAIAVPVGHYTISSTSTFDDQAMVDDKTAALSNDDANFSCLSGYGGGGGGVDGDVKQECSGIKQEALDADEYGQDFEAQFAAAIQTDSCHQQLAAVFAAVAAAAAAENEPVGVVSSGRSAVKRHLDCDASSSSSSSSSFASSMVPIKKNAHSANNANASHHHHYNHNNHNQLQQKHNLAPSVAPLLSPHQVSSSTHQNHNPTPYAALSPTITGTDFLLETTDLSQTTQVDVEPCVPSAVEPEAVLQLLNNENLNHRYNELESNMHIQGVQINAIEGNLGRVPRTREQLGFQTDLTHLKEQHVMQKKILMTLQKDHHSLQNRVSVDAMNISSNIHQNVGV